MEIRVVADYEALLAYVPEWEHLAMSAIEPNPFYEHWMLLPAIRHLGAGRDVQLVFVFDTGHANGSRPPLLCGVFPLERHRHYLNLPVSAWGLWRHSHCPLTTPLIRVGFAQQCMEALFDWLFSKAASCHLLELSYVSAEGTFHQVLVDQVHASGSTPILCEVYTRALFRPMESADHYFVAALSGKHRKALKRRADLLAELGPVEFIVADNEADISGWIESFLRIESSGWKGREGSAMACQAGNRSFFVEAVTSAFRRNQLLMTATRVGGKTIAQNCYFRGGKGSFHFKPAFDEEYARFSPGFHMECELIRYLHSQPEIEWMDSCTSSDNEMYNRLFLHRRTIQTMLVPVGKGAKAIIVSAIPLLKTLKRTVYSAVHSSPAEVPVQAEKQ